MEGKLQFKKNNCLRRVWIESFLKRHNDITIIMNSFFGYFKKEIEEMPPGITMKQIYRMTPNVLKYWSSAVQNI